MASPGLRCLVPPECPTCSADADGFLVLCERCGCRRCPEGERDAILADTEDWPRPVCIDCCDEVGGDPMWHTREQPHAVE